MIYNNFKNYKRCMNRKRVYKSPLKINKKYKKYE